MLNHLHMPFEFGGLLSGGARRGLIKIYNIVTFIDQALRIAQLAEYKVLLLILTVVGLRVVVALRIVLRKLAFHDSLDLQVASVVKSALGTA